MMGRYFVAVETERGAFVPPGSMRVTTTDHSGLGESVVLHGVPHVVTSVRHREMGEQEHGVPLTAPVVFVVPCHVARALARRRRRS